MTLEEIENDIVSACAQAAIGGFEIVPRTFGCYARGAWVAGCALAALQEARANKSESHNPVLFARERYDWTYDQVFAFASGFDRTEHGKTLDLRLYEMGRRVRDLVLP